MDIPTICNVLGIPAVYVPWIGFAVTALLLIMSEALSLNPKWKSNGIIQLVINVLSKLRPGPFIKTGIVLCSIASSFGCAANVTNVQRDAIRELIVAAPECQSGYAMLGITGHRPDCLTVEQVRELQDAGIL